MQEKKKLYKQLAALECLILSFAVVGLTFAPGQERKPDWPVDCYGDSLPSGAIARIGTNRMRHIRNVVSVVLSHDSRLIATICDLKRHVSVWDSATGMEIRRLELESDEIVCCAFSQDGKTIACAGGSISLFDIANGKLVAFVKGPEGAFYSAVAFSPDGSSVVGSSSDYLIHVWNAGLKKRLQFPSGHTSTIHTLSFSADTSALATVCEKGVMRIWEISQEGNAQERIKIDDAISSMSFATKKQVAAYGSRLGVLALIDLKKGVPIWRRQICDGPIGSVSISSDNRHLMASGYASPISIWDLDKGNAASGYGDFTGVFGTASFFNDDTLISWPGPHGDIWPGVGDRTIHFWDVKDGREIEKWIGHSSPLLGIAVSDDGNVIATVAFDGVRIWDGLSGKQVLKLKIGIGARLIALSPDKSTFATGEQRTDGELALVRVWKTSDGSELLRFETVDHTISGLAYSRDGKRLFISGESVLEQRFADTGKPISRWGELIQTQEKASTRDTFRNAHLSLSPDERFVAWIGKRREFPTFDRLILHDALSGSQIAISAEPYSLMGPLAFSEDNRMMLVGKRSSSEWSCTLSVVERQTLKERIAISTNGIECNVASFAPDSKRIICGCRDGRIRIWNVTDGKLIETLHGHTESVGALAIARNGRFLVSGSDDTTALVWDKWAMNSK